MLYELLNNPICYGQLMLHIQSPLFRHCYFLPFPSICQPYRLPENNHSSWHCSVHGSVKILHQFVEEWSMGFPGKEMSQSDATAECQICIRRRPGISPNILLTAFLSSLKFCLMNTALKAFLFYTPKNLVKCLTSCITHTSDGLLSWCLYSWLLWFSLWPLSF